ESLQLLLDDLVGDHLPGMLGQLLGVPIRRPQETVNLCVQRCDFESRGRPRAILESSLDMSAELAFQFVPKQDLDLGPGKGAPTFDHSIHARFYDHKACRQKGRALPCELRVSRPQGNGYGLGDKILEMDAAAEHIPAISAAGMSDTGHIDLPACVTLLCTGHVTGALV